MEAVAVYSDADAEARHVRLADVAVRIGPPPPSESYLRIDAIVEAARSTGAQAIHPGYGFLAERASFARAVEDAGLVFVGPPSDSIDALGDKLHARRTARSVGVDAVPGTLEPAPVDRPDQIASIVAEAERIGFPLLVKAAAGGGGRGMRRVTTAAELPAALAGGSREAASAFGDGSVYLEREIVPARHIEVQLLGDATGHVVAIGERDCSLQRRHQKLVEEAPAPGLSIDERRELHAMAVKVATAAGLRNAATAEFLRAPDGSFYFLEVNTRLQVEHGVTELVSGLDIVREQFWLAAGRPLSEDALTAAARAASPAGHAIEVRIAAEDPAREFTPTPGRVRRWEMPDGPGVRVDTGIGPGTGSRPSTTTSSPRSSSTPATGTRPSTACGGPSTRQRSPGSRRPCPSTGSWLGAKPSGPAELSTGWVGEHWDGPAEYERAARVAMLSAGLDAMAGGLGIATAVDGAVVPPGPGASTAGGRNDGRWRHAAEVGRHGPVAGMTPTTSPWSGWWTPRGPGRPRSDLRPCRSRTDDHRAAGGPAGPVAARDRDGVLGGVAMSPGEFRTVGDPNAGLAVVDGEPGTFRLARSGRSTRP